MCLLLHTVLMNIFKAHAIHMQYMYSYCASPSPSPAAVAPH